MQRNLYGWYLHMDKIQWCAQKKDGLQFIAPNANLAQAYIKKAEEALESMQVNIIKDWKISTAYYTIYFSLYALLMKLGVKCEIHSCTIAFTKRFLKEFFEQSDLAFTDDALQARIDSQYYIDRTVPDKQYEQIIQKAPHFLVTCKAILNKLNEKKVMDIRKQLETTIATSSSQSK